MAVSLDKIEEQAKVVAERENCSLYDIELVGAGNNRILRVFIDKDGQQGVSIDDCSRVSRALDLILDVEDLVPGGRYQLEVSSPGLERVLRHPWHFEKATGEQVQFQLSEALGDIDPETPESQHKRKKLSGFLTQYRDGRAVVSVQLSGESQELQIPIDKIRKAKVVYDFEKQGNPKKKN